MITESEWRWISRNFDVDGEPEAFARFERLLDIYREEISADNKTEAEKAEDYKILQLFAFWGAK